MLMESALQAIRAHGMIAPGDRILVAVSGGLDSVVLLDVLQQLTKQLHCEWIVGHVDHGLRGEDSTEDAAFVESLASSYGLPVHVDRLAPADLNAGRGHGREGAARAARLTALQAMAHRAGAARIALAHTANDRAETVLYRFARGTGPAGLQGILPIRSPFIRPLIHTSRDAVADYADAHELKWREDASNADLSFARNRIRHRVLPELHALNSEVVDALCRASALLADLDEAIQYFVADHADRLAEGMEDATGWPRSAMCDLPESVARLLVREGIRRARGHLEGISLQHVDAVRSLVCGTDAHGELSLPGLRVSVDRNALSFNTPADCAPPPPPDVPLQLGDNALPNGHMLRLTLLPYEEVDPASTQADPWSEIADADRVTFPLQLRGRRPGDRFRPLGLNANVKLKDFLINAHTAYFTRDRIPLVCDASGIIWVVGLRLSDTVRVSDQTEHVLRMEMKGPR